METYRFVVEIIADDYEDAETEMRAIIDRHADVPWWGLPDHLLDVAGVGRGDAK